MKSYERSTIDKTAVRVASIEKRGVRPSSSRRAVQARKKNIHRMAALVLMVLILSIWGIRYLGMTAHADEIPSDRTKYYTSILIESGDTLWTIAEEYMSPEYDSLSDYVSELKFMNGLTGSTIYAGDYLTIAYYK